MFNFINYPPFVSQIMIYPIKSLDGVSVPQAKVLPSGALKYDRQWAIFDENDQLVNGKRNNKIYELRAYFHSNFTAITLDTKDDQTGYCFSIITELKQLESFLSHHFGCFVYLRENKIKGFPDDTNASGPTIISTATLGAIARWFPELSVEEIRRRLRCNIEINGVPAFWEDRLFANKNEWVDFQIGDINFQGINPCQRCIVPTKDSSTGEVTKNFQKQFIKQRKKTLPHWVNSSQFNHFYRVSVNTKVTKLQQETNLKVGDEVKIIDN